MVWHGKAGKAVSRLKEFVNALLALPAYEFGTLWWNPPGVAGYVRESPGLVNYAQAALQRVKGLPVSSSIAESAVNQATESSSPGTCRCRCGRQSRHTILVATPT